MSEIKRIYVEKKKGYDIEAGHLFADIKENLGADALSGLRILYRYDIEGISEDAYEKAKKTIFSEPPVDIIHEESFELAADECEFGMEYLPGQYDQRADSAMQCIQIITGDDSTLISCAKIFVLKGSVNDKELQRIKEYCINPVDSREAAAEKPKTLKMDLTVPEDVAIVTGFITKSNEELYALKAELGLAMSDADIVFCRDYFKNTEKRDPSITEIRVIDTYWSDHCRHTTFSTNIENVEFKDGKYKDTIEGAYKMYLDQREKLGRTEKPLCLMDIAVMGMRALKAEGKLDNLDESEEINACSIVVPVDIDGVEEEWLIMFKNETHNHPTEIEPFGGAATCLGGAIRDPLSGRSYVYQAMRVTGSGDPRTSVADTLHGKLPQRKITTSAAHGYSSYGNQIGLATGMVSEVYDEGYVAKRMEIGAVIGAAKKSDVIRERPQKGDVIILTGGRTGRDGCGGATGSSKEHNEDSILTCGAEVQKGNPPTERKLQRLFRNSEVSRMIKRCNDFGAGGVSVAIGELAEGLVIDLNAVPKKYEGLDGTELAISESQERMAVVVDKKDVDRFIELAKTENLEATKVADVTDDRRLKMYWRDKAIVDISRDFLDTNGAKQYTDICVEEPSSSFPKSDAEGADLKEKWINNLQQLNVACQKGLVERFDSTIGAGSVLMPFGGKNQLTPIEAMSAKVPVLRGETTTATLMSYGYDPTISKYSPFHGAALAVVESVSKIVAAGGKYSSCRLTFQEYFERLGTDPKRWGKPFSALLGGFYAQMKLGTAAIGGKDSMSGTFKDLDVPPTLVSFAVDVTKYTNVISPEFKKAGNKIVKLSVKYLENDLPDFDELMRNFDKVTELVKAKNIVSAATIGFGGVAAAVSKMAFGNDIGAVISDDDLFGKSYGSFVLEVEGDADALFKGFNYNVIGETVSDKSITANGVKIDLDEAKEAWFKPLEKVFPTNYYKPFEKKDISVPLFNIIEKRTSGMSLAAPRVLMPVFPGTNCEYDTLRSFERAGADAKTLVISNLKNSWLEESIDKMAEMIKNSQIIMIPGGFSAGDEPEGSGKFIAAVFRNPKIKEAVTDLLQNRDGLMLGICNGFQALIKLGLVPYGEIRDMEDDSPTLTFNTIGRHISCMADTKIISNKSPWLWGTNAGDIHTVAFSHGEGRFVAEESVIKKLAENNQIATQYVDFNGDPTYDIKYNPNGSLYAIEGITSPDGRVLGKMGHSERLSSGTFKNIVGTTDQWIYKSGVNYFK